MPMLTIAETMNEGGSGDPSRCSQFLPQLDRRGANTSGRPGWRLVDVARDASAVERSILYRSAQVEVPVMVILTV
jgi:hypothetical protein